MIINLLIFFFIQVVAWLRQPNIMDILCERHSGLRTSPALRDKVTAIRVDGTAALDRLSHDVDLTIVLRSVIILIKYQSTALDRRG